MEILTEIDQKYLTECCEKHHVVNLYLFGSMLREDFNGKISDVDLLVEFDELKRDL